MLPYPKIYNKYKENKYKDTLIYGSMVIKPFINVNLSKKFILKYVEYQPLIFGRFLGTGGGYLIYLTYCCKFLLFNFLMCLEIKEPHCFIITLKYSGTVTKVSIDQIKLTLNTLTTYVHKKDLNISVISISNI